jgi:hypothetical protein
VPCQLHYCKRIGTRQTAGPHSHRSLARLPPSGTRLKRQLNAYNSRRNPNSAIRSAGNAR